MSRSESLAFLSSLVVVLGLAACAYGPKTKDKTVLESLNGKHYEAAQFSTGSLPIVKRHKANVAIAGKVLLQVEPVPFPLSFAEIELIQDSKSLAQTRTSGDGSFTLSGDFSDGQATLRLISTKYSGERSITIRGFEVRDIDFYVK